jgi:hypothetical protein
VPSGEVIRGALQRSPDPITKPAHLSGLRHHQPRAQNSSVDFPGRAADDRDRLTLAASTFTDRSTSADAIHPAIPRRIAS